MEKYFDPFILTKNTVKRFLFFIKLEIQNIYTKDHSGNTYLTLTFDKREYKDVLEKYE